jgi:hypothetical protein
MDSAAGLMLFAGMAGHIMAFDPDYVRDFWTQSGYLGHDQPDLLTSLLVEGRASISAVVTADDVVARHASAGSDGPPPLMVTLMPPDFPVGVVLDGVDRQAITAMPGVLLTLTSGAGAGRLLRCTGVAGDVVLVASLLGAPPLDGIAAGDTIVFDNREYLAFCYYYRSQARVEHEHIGTYHPEWRQLVVDNRPAYPQREPFDFDQTAAVEPYTGRFHGKMILLQNQLDATNLPVHGEAYARKVRTRLGEEVDDSFRIWWAERASHGAPSMYLPGHRPAASTWLIDYSGMLQQAVNDLIDWVEHGQAPAKVSYHYTTDNQLVLPRSGPERGGIQPVVELEVDGGTSARADLGASVSFRASSCVPADAGRIISVEWDFESNGSWEEREGRVDGSHTAIDVKADHRFEKPGTYFPSVRVTAQRAGQLHATLCRVQNLARVRVVVE